jgi:hypothetical protein
VAVQIGNEEEERRPGVAIDGGLVAGLVVEVDGDLIQMKNDGAQARFSGGGVGFGLQHDLLLLAGEGGRDRARRKMMKSMVDGVYLYHP